jgi:hypothetical protein
MYSVYTFIFILLAVIATLSMTATFPFNPYKRNYAPPGISDGSNKSPYYL